MIDALVVKYRLNMENSSYIFLYMELYKRIIEKDNLDKTIRYVINYFELKYTLELDSRDVENISKAIFALHNELKSYNEIIKYDILDDDLLYIVSPIRVYYKSFEHDK